RSLAVRHYVILSPRRAGPNGIPTANRVTGVMSTVAAARAETERLRDLAVRQGDTIGVRARPVAAGDLRRLLTRTVAGCADAVLHAGEVVVADQHACIGTVVELPTRVLPGAVMSAIIRSRTRGTVSYHLIPVQPAEARKELRRQESLYKAMFQRSKSADVEMLYRHARALDEMLLSRQTSALRVALTVSVHGATRREAELAFERLQTALLDEELALQRVTTPIAQLAASAAPGGRPLNRSLFLTTGDVAAYLLPGQGGAFEDPSRPLIGVDAATSATCWYSVFDRTNFSALILGSSGAGKSVAAKTLLMRHHGQGADVLVVDPESEYETVITALGGRYVELGDQSLNAFAIPPEVPAEEAAGWVTRMLSVMGGEERDFQNNRPVRALAAQDMAWLFGEVTSFFNRWRDDHGRAEAVLSNFCEHLEGPALRAASQLGVEGRVKRCADIAERLRAYTQGDKGRVFDRPSTVSLTGHAVGVGLYHLAGQLRADLTPALAFVLAALLGELQKMDRRRLILVDEAHKVLSDPDAGEVLADVVRTSRKRGAGVWMASQSIRDFLPQGQAGRPSPGEVLATVAATKLILGVEHGLEAGVQEAFGLSEAELAAITSQRRPGRGVLIAEQERAIIDVLPGGHLLPIVGTSSVTQRAR
ncbi:MAG: VirB4 family type IV secretion system protein, partial [Candidatus Dormibacteraceae bacterium]